MAVGRQNKDTDGIGESLLDVRRSLDINVQQKIVTISSGFAKVVARRAVAISVNIRIFEKFSVADHAIELLHWNKMIMLAVLLTPARRTRGVRDGELEIGNEFQQVVGEG